MGFLSNAIKNRRSFQNVSREPGFGMPEKSIFEQRNPFLPPQTPITPPVNITGPVLPRMKPPVIPPRPPSIGGVGGINQDFIRDIDPNAPARQKIIDAQGNISAGDIIEQPKLRPLIQEMRPPVTPPLEDRGFGPGITRTPDFMDPRFIEQTAPFVLPPGYKEGKIGNRQGMPFQPVQAVNPQPAPFVPPQQPPRVPLSERTDIFGAGKKYDPANLPEGFSYDRPSEGIFSSVMPSMGNVYAYGPDGQRIEVASGIQSPGINFTFPGSGLTPPDFVEKENKGPVSLRDQYGLQPIVPPNDNNPPPTPDVGLANSAPVTDPVVDPVVTPTDTPATTIPEDSRGQVDPVLAQQDTIEMQTDPLLRSLYFGTADQPGYVNQVQQATANLINSDVPLQVTAGLTPLEVLAREQAISGIGGFEPFLQQNQNLVNEAIGQSMRAEALRDPYYGRAERQMQIGAGEELQGIGQARGITTGATDRFGGSLGRIGRQAIGSTQDYGGSLGESENLLRGTLGAYDPGMTQQFYNPYEDAVVQQTIDDVLKAGDKQDIAARAREISSGAFGGSRARLGAEERRQDLGEGLAKALSGIRQTGFTQAQQTGLGEFARQRAAERAASSGLAGLSGSRLGAQQQLGTTLRGLTGDQFGAQQQLAANLMGYGAAGSGARQNLASGLLGIGQQRGAGASALGSQLAGYGSQIGGIGQTQEQMRAGQRGELAGFGGVGRGIQETAFSRLFQQQVDAQGRPLQALQVAGQLLPQFQAGSTQIDSKYRLPVDPSARGLGAALSAYSALAPSQGNDLSGLGAAFGGYGTQA